MTRPVLALDPATQLGWAFLDGDGSITSGTVRLSSAGGAARVVAFEQWLWPRLAPLRGGRGLVAYEQPVLVRGRAAAHRVLCHLEGALLAMTSACSVPIAYHTPGAIKAWATGSGRAAKADVIAAMRDRGFDPADDNEADALALLGLVTDNYGRTPCTA